MAKMPGRDESQNVMVLAFCLKAAEAERAGPGAEQAEPGAEQA
eukprot:CAMPEP_0184713534 /NCGR_PEP_ID=MMETSP0314-20130426/3860_1 /TAXON_ID=38298 /ORGANISM="Rhodella maculata, Strain CCMP 736" /LENGTH=42 /DNA_ID= /DNA_START= /DNA_END= /DNA_ORIENTATION=